MMGQGRATESSAGASLTHVGQSSVEIGLMNRGEGVKRRGGSSFNITRHYRSSSGISRLAEEEMERSEGGISQAVKGIPETNHLLLNCRGWFPQADRGYTRHWECF